MWLPLFTAKIERDACEQYKSLKKALLEANVVYSRYKVDPPAEALECKKVLDATMVMCSEALLLRALVSEDPAKELRDQMKRMADQRVGQVNQTLLHAAHQIVMK